MNLSLRYFVIGAPCAAVLASLLAFGLVSFNSSRESLIEARGDKLMAVATAQRRAVMGLYASWRNRVALVASRTRMRQLIAKGADRRTAADTALLRKIMNDAVTSDSGMSSFSVLSLDGKPIAVTNGQGRSASEWLRGKRPDQITGTVFLGVEKRAGDVLIGFAAPITLEGKTIAIGVFELGIGELVEIARNYNGLGRTGETVIARRLPNGDAQFIVPLRHDENAAFRRSVPAARRDIPITLALQGHETVLPDGMVDYRNVPVLAATQYIRVLDWALLTKIDRKEALAPAGALLMNFTMLGAIIFLVAAAASILLAQMLLRPVTRLTRATQQVGMSAAMPEVPDSVFHELSLFSQAFNRMTARLTAAIESTEREAANAQGLSEELRRAKEQLNEAIESIPEGFALWSHDDRLIMRNNVFKNLYPNLTDKLVPGVAYEEFVRAAFERGIFSRDGDDLETAVKARIARHRSSVSAFENELGDGRWVRVSKRKTKSGQTVAILSDITEQVAANEIIQTMAREDSLTGLPNRAKFHEELESALAQADRTGRQVGVMLLDLDHFKAVNDTLGHEGGDLLLVEVAERISNCIRKTDTVARLGGDEFAVILTNVEAADGVLQVSRKILKALSVPFDLNGKAVQSGASIGVTIYPKDDGDQGQLLRNADTALYKAKGEGRGTFWLFDESLQNEVQARITLEDDIREALAENQFFMVYQPQVDFRSGEMIGAEALIRWSHPERGIVSPAEFIPMAEATRQIIEIGDWVLQDVCRQSARWIADGIALPCISVNISPLQFRQENLVERIRAALDASGLDPGQLGIEVTEGMAMRAGDEAVTTLCELKAMGVALAIDDFGTGFSSLNRLKEFPVDRLKIDQSFIQHVMSNESDTAICSAVIQLGHTLNLKVIAEGAESYEQVEYLAQIGCDEVQGYFISRPLSAPDFAQFIEDYQPLRFGEAGGPAAGATEPVAMRRRRKG